MINSSPQRVETKNESGTNVNNPEGTDNSKLSSKPPPELSKDELQLSSTNPDLLSPKEALEIKDAEIIFNTVWNNIVAKYGKANLQFPVPLNVC